MEPLEFNAMSVKVKIKNNKSSVKARAAVPIFGWFNRNTDGKEIITDHDSDTVPDASLSVREILDRYTRGLPTSNAKDPQFADDPDFDDYDETHDLGFDIIDAHNAMEDITLKKKEDVALKRKKDVENNVTIPSSTTETSAPSLPSQTPQTED